MFRRSRSHRHCPQGTKTTAGLRISLIDVLEGDAYRARIDDVRGSSSSATPATFPIALRRGARFTSVGELRALPDLERNTVARAGVAPALENYAELVTSSCVVRCRMHAHTVKQYRGTPGIV